MFLPEEYTIGDVKKDLNGVHMFFLAFMNQMHSLVWKWDITKQSITFATIQSYNDGWSTIYLLYLSHACVFYTGSEMEMLTFFTSLSASCDLRNNSH